MTSKPSLQCGRNLGSTNGSAEDTSRNSLEMGAPGRVELPTNGLGNRCSIHLSYGAGVVQSNYLM